MLLGKATDDHRDAPPDLVQAASELWPMNRYRQGLVDVLASYRALHGEDQA